jgi:hypothetical protein
LENWIQILHVCFSHCPSVGEADWVLRSSLSTGVCIWIPCQYSSNQSIRLTTVLVWGHQCWLLISNQWFLRKMRGFPCPTIYFLIFNIVFVFLAKSLLRWKIWLGIGVWVEDFKYSWQSSWNLFSAVSHLDWLTPEVCQSGQIFISPKENSINNENCIWILLSINGSHSQPPSPKEVSWFLSDSFSPWSCSNM